MVRRVTPAQFRAAVQKAQRQQKKAVNDYKREVRTYNAAVRRHNTAVENQRRRLDQEIRRVNSRESSTFTGYRTSVTTLARSYEETEQHLAGHALSVAEREIVDRVSEGAADSAYLLNALDGDGDPEADPTEDELRSPSLQTELQAFSPDLVARWTGALFALSPSNPDAARHFCTSARELMIEMLNIAAPDPDVLAADPTCDTRDNGEVTRKAKVKYLVNRRGVTDVSITDLVEADQDNVVTLFRTFNQGTHGQAGRFDITQLNAVRQRVESAVSFVHSLCF
ncbi:hypothetical protein [Nocardioides sp. NPDC004968]|uniref:pPIWI-associating nuclease domain-containing protein n=1 Tax=Nocardioides sp. NPDC004968 TaxID=3155894 RepID=UPI0033ABE2B7